MTISVLITTCIMIRIEYYSGPLILQMTEKKRSIDSARNFFFLRRILRKTRNDRQNKTRTYQKLHSFHEKFSWVAVERILSYENTKNGIHELLDWIRIWRNRCFLTANYRKIRNQLLYHPVKFRKKCSMQSFRNANINKMALFCTRWEVFCISWQKMHITYST